MQASLAQSLIIHYKNDNKASWEIIERLLFAACNWIGTKEGLLSERLLAERELEAQVFFRDTFGCEK